MADRPPRRNKSPKVMIQSPRKRQHANEPETSRKTQKAVRFDSSVDPSTPETAQKSGTPKASQSRPQAGVTKRRDPKVETSGVAGRLRGRGQPLPEKKKKKKKKTGLPTPDPTPKKPKPKERVVISSSPSLSSSSSSSLKDEDEEEEEEEEEEPKTWKDYPYDDVAYQREERVHRHLIGWSREVWPMPEPQEYPKDDPEVMPAPALPADRKNEEWRVQRPAYLDTQDYFTSELNALFGYLAEPPAKDAEKDMEYPEASCGVKCPGMIQKFAARHFRFHLGRKPWDERDWDDDPTVDQDEANKELEENVLDTLAGNYSESGRPGLHDETIKIIEMIAGARSGTEADGFGWVNLFVNRWERVWLVSAIMGAVISEHVLQAPWFGGTKTEGDSMYSYDYFYQEEGDGFSREKWRAQEIRTSLQDAPGHRPTNLQADVNNLAAKLATILYPIVLLKPTRSKDANFKERIEQNRAVGGQLYVELVPIIRRAARLSIQMRLDGSTLYHFSEPLKNERPDPNKVWLDNEARMRRTNLSALAKRLRQQVAREKKSGIPVSAAVAVPRTDVRHQISSVATVSWPIVTAYKKGGWLEQERGQGFRKRLVGVGWACGRWVSMGAGGWEGRDKECNLLHEALKLRGWRPTYGNGEWFAPKKGKVPVKEEKKLEPEPGNPEPGNPEPGNPEPSPKDKDPNANPDDGKDPILYPNLPSSSSDASSDGSNWLSSNEDQLAFRGMPDGSDDDMGLSEPLSSSDNALEVVDPAYDSTSAPLTSSYDESESESARHPQLQEQEQEQDNGQLEIVDPAFDSASDYDDFDEPIPSTEDYAEYGYGAEELGQELQSESSEEGIGGEQVAGYGDIEAEYPDYESDYSAPASGYTTPVAPENAQGRGGYWGNFF